MKRILIVDDEKEIRELLRDKLSKSQYDVLTASSGKDALRIARDSRPNLILLDIAMPQMDGYAVCDEIKSESATQDIPVLFLTGKDLDPQGIEERCRELSASGYISKLSSLKELLDKLKETLG